MPPGDERDNAATVEEHLREILERVRRAGAAAALLPAPLADAPRPPKAWSDTDDDDEGEEG